MAKRVKLNGPAITSREQMERLVGEICDLTILQDKATTKMNKRLMEVRVDFEKFLVENQAAIDMKMTLAKDWADANLGEFGGKKSIDMVHGLVGYRTGTPKLKPLKGWTWDRVLEALRAGNYGEAIRTKTEIDKEYILAQREKISDERMKSIGVKVVQEESFFVEPKRETVEEQKVPA